MVRDSNGTSGNEVTIERKYVECEDLLTFDQGKPDFSKQFAHIYAARLKELREVIDQKVKEKWGGVEVKKLTELKDYDGKQCILIGTLYKHQQWKPSILRELSDDHQLIMPTPKPNYCSEEDQPFLEDEMLRIKLVGPSVDIKFIVTGIVCGILGYEQEDSFYVEDWCFPGCVPKNLPLISSTKGKLIIVSGLNLANESDSLAAHIFSEFVCGMAGNPATQEEGAAIVRIIIAGNTVKSDTAERAQKGHSENKAQETAIAKEIVTAIKKTDGFLAELAKFSCVILMPGQHDPTSVMMPQYPVHPCLLPESMKLRSFKCATNPWVGKIGDRIIMGNSGQPIHDLKKVSGDNEISSLEWLKKTLIWRHMCPTAPDTLPAMPFHEKDSFVMKQTPDIYFTGNMEKYETELWKEEGGSTVRLISVPQFFTTHTAVIIDLETLETHHISFGSG